MSTKAELHDALKYRIVADSPAVMFTGGGHPRLVVLHGVEYTKDNYGAHNKQLEVTTCRA